MTLWLLSTAVLALAVGWLDRPRHYTSTNNWQGTTLLDIICYIIFSGAITGLIWLVAFWK